MSKRKITAAAKRKGLSVVYACWGWTAGDRESYQQWEVQFGPEIDDVFGEDEFQYFESTPEAMEWIAGLEPATPVTLATVKPPRYPHVRVPAVAEIKECTNG